MAKLYFKYGAMGSSKTAQALITRFNYIEMGMRVWLIKPSKDTRDGDNKVSSRIGLSAEARNILETDDISSIFDREQKGKTDVIIADEAQFFTPDQIDQLHEIAVWEDIPVLCFGLRTDFMLRLFPGSRRLLELAESITEIKTICRCGSKATVNVRFLPDGRVATEGEQIVIGGNETYKAMCYKCMQQLIRQQSGK
ncbi:MAG: thymidine kinase [Clostridia bacterium]|nr:thymidine kinase [Clostridia bacterium]